MGPPIFYRDHAKCKLVSTISGCHHGQVVYNSQVRIHGKNIRLALVVALGVFAAGCGGLNGTTSVSPASFFLPGIMKADPAPAGRTLQTAPAPVMVVAQAQ
jgi:hypothetical protein